MNNNKVQLCFGFYLSNATWLKGTAKTHLWLDVSPQTISEPEGFLKRGWISISKQAFMLWDLIQKQKRVTFFFEARDISFFLFHFPAHLKRGWFAKRQIPKIYPCFCKTALRVLIYIHKGWHSVFDAFIHSHAHTALCAFNHSHAQHNQLFGCGLRDVLSLCHRAASYNSQDAGNPPTAGHDKAAGRAAPLVIVRPGEIAQERFADSLAVSVAPPTLDTADSFVV